MRPRANSAFLKIPDRRASKASFLKQLQQQRRRKQRQKQQRQDRGSNSSSNEGGAAAGAATTTTTTTSASVITYTATVGVATAVGPLTSCMFPCAGIIRCLA